MENDVLDSLSDVGYAGPLKDENAFLKALEEGPKNAEFRNLIVWICKELRTLLNLDETVNEVSDEEVSNFLMEISSLLKELGCPYQGLTDGPLTDRLGNKEQRLLVLDYLLSELMAARIVRVECPDAGPELRIQESETAKTLKALLISLQFPRPPDNISAGALFTKVEAKLKEVLSRAPADLRGKPIIAGRLSTEQWKTLKQLDNEMQQEYKLRREMLLKRLDVTINSFQWCDKAKSNEDAIAKKFIEKRNALKAEPDITLADILAAREDLAVIQKTSSSNFRKNTQSSIQKVIIGRVPDRGGRPSEQEAPPPEMPSWQKDRAQGGGGGGFSRGGGGFSKGGGGGGGGFSRGGGGRVQGGWNDGGHQGGDQRRNDRGQQDYRRDDRVGHQDHRRDDRSGHQGSRGGYQDRRGDYQDDRGHRGGQRGRGGGGRGRDYR